MQLRLPSLWSQTRRGEWPRTVQAKQVLQASRNTVSAPRAPPHMAAATSNLTYFPTRQRRALGAGVPHGTERRQQDCPAGRGPGPTDGAAPNAPHCVRISSRTINQEESLGIARSRSADRATRFAFKTASSVGHRQAPCPFLGTAKHYERALERYQVRPDVSRARLDGSKSSTSPTANSDSRRRATVPGRRSEPRPAE